MKRYTIGLITGIFLTTGYSQNYIIDEYKFEWITAEVRDLKMEISKEEDHTQIILHKKSSMGNYLFLSPSDAYHIGKALEKTNDFYSKMIDSQEEINKKIDAGDYFVQFNQSPKSGFKVYIAKDGTSYLNFYIDRKTAIGIAEHLIDAEQRVNFLNEKLKNITK